jgi:hypothetical protein
VDLRDEDAANYRWSDGELDRHIGRAVVELSVVLPREQKTTLTTSAGSRELSIAGLTDLLRIAAVEWPVGNWPPTYVQFSVWQTTLTLLVDAAPAGVEDVAVYWERVHQVDETTSTLPVEREDVVLLGAAGYAAVEWASFATNRANIAGSDVDRDYAIWGRSRLAEFSRQLRRLSARLKSGRLYVPAAAEPNQETVLWEP